MQNTLSGFPLKEKEVDSRYEFKKRILRALTENIYHTGTFKFGHLHLRTFQHPFSNPYSLVIG